MAAGDARNLFALIQAATATAAAAAESIVAAEVVMLMRGRMLMRCANEVMTVYIGVALRACVRARLRKLNAHAGRISAVLMMTK